jgi:hypothetical protein
MKHALDVYEELKDASEYALDDWLRLPASEDLAFDLINLNAASAFLFDRLFAKENAGAEVTKCAQEDLMERYNAQALSDTATELLLRMKQADFDKDQSDFAGYYRFIIQTEDYVKEAPKDSEGMLALVYIEKLISLIMKANKEQNSLRVGEVVFVNLTAAWMLIYKELYGPRFVGLRSSPYFEGVEEAASRIRCEINE